MRIFSLSRYGTIIAICVLGVTAAAATDKRDANLGMTQTEFERIAAKLEKLSRIQTPEAVKELSLVLTEIAKVDSKLGAQKLDPKVRRFRCQLMLRGAALLKSKIDPNFDPDDVPATNIAPEGPYRSGVAPEAIKEPEIRRKYEAAIRENKEKAERYNLQHQLRKIWERYPKRSIYPFLQINYDEAKPEDQQELEELFEQEVNDDKLREHLTKGLAEFRKRHLPGSLALRARSNDDAPTDPGISDEPKSR